MRMSKAYLEAVAVLLPTLSFPPLTPEPRED